MEYLIVACVAKSFEECYKKTNERLNKLEVRLIGAQAISLARFSFRLVDQLHHEKENETFGGVRLLNYRVIDTLRKVHIKRKRSRIIGAALGSL